MLRKIPTLEQQAQMTYVSQGNSYSSTKEIGILKLFTIHHLQSAPILLQKQAHMQTPTHQNWQRNPQGMTCSSGCWDQIICQPSSIFESHLSKHLPRTTVSRKTSDMFVQLCSISELWMSEVHAFRLSMCIMLNGLWDSIIRLYGLSAKLQCPSSDIKFTIMNLGFKTIRIWWMRQDLHPLT